MIKTEIKKNGRHNMSEGFTLIEVMLYIAIVALLVFSVGISAQAFIESRVKNQSIADVNHAGANALNYILQAVRNADSISAPTSGTSANQLELAMTSAPQNPTCFRLSGEKIQTQEGTASCAGTWIDITDSEKVTVSLMTGDTGIFTNLSRASTPGIIRARFNVLRKQPVGVSRYFQDHEKDFQGAASLR